MLLPRLQPPLRAAIASIGRTGSGSTAQMGLNEAFAALNVCGRTAGIRVAETGVRVSGTRYASHKAQGAVNKAKDGPGKRLGAKKSGGKHARSLQYSTSPNIRNDNAKSCFSECISHHDSRATADNSSPLQSNMSSPATSSSANAARIGSPAKTAPWAATTPSTPPRAAT